MARIAFCVKPTIVQSESTTVAYVNWSIFRAGDSYMCL